MSAWQWQDFSNEDYDAAGFTPDALNDFVKLKKDLDSRAQSLSVGDVVKIMNAAFKGTIVPEIETKDDFDIFMEAFADIKKEREDDGPR